MLVAAAAVVMSGCSGAPRPDVTAHSDSDVRGDRAARGALRENGLFVRRLRIADAPGPIAGAFARYAATSPLDEDLVERLDRSGIRLVLVPLDDLDRVVSELGGAQIDRTVWHGQAPTWRPLVERSIGGQDVVGIEGRLRTFEAGTMRLMMRGWLLMMEDGPRVQLELLPDFDQTRPREMDRLLGRPRFDGVRFLSLHMELLLEPNLACVITMERPGAEWIAGHRADAPRAGRQEPDEAPGSASARTSVIAGGGTLVGAGPGPVYLPPRTLGEVFFHAEGRPRGREVIILIPAVAADETAASAGPVAALGRETR